MPDTDIQHKVKPYRFLRELDFVSKGNKQQLRNGWRPIFTTMAGAPGVVIPKKEEDVTDEIVDSTYTIATDFLKERYSYIFKKSTEISLTDMSIFTWSRKVQNSEVRKFGTPSDKAYLSASRRKNPLFHTRKRVCKAVPRGPKRGKSRRQEAAAAAAANNNNSDNSNDDSVGGDFGREFGRGEGDY